MRSICLDCHTARVNQDSCHILKAGHVSANHCDAPFFKELKELLKQSIEKLSYLEHQVVVMDPLTWSYLNEGNLHLIVKYTGNDLTMQGKVLRLLKGEVMDNESVMFKQAFLEHVIQPLLGEKYTVCMTPVHTSTEFLQRLAERIEPLRPVWRRNRQIALNLSTSFLLADLSQTHLEGTSFELKPKWGFKPSLISDTKSQVCRFCMHSHLRNIPDSGYCPLDLYSTDSARVKKAIDILINDATMKKTLRITASTKHTAELLRNILLKDPILQRLKYLQSRLDGLDVERIYELYKRHADALQTDDINIWKQVISNFQTRDESSASDKQRIYEYVLSMTFKDCSLMINTHIANTNDSQTVTLLDGSIHAYDIKVIDTDLKRIDKIPYWYELDQTIVQNTIQTHFTKKCQQ